MSSWKNFVTDALASLWTSFEAATPHCTIGSMADDCNIAMGHLCTNLSNNKKQQWIQYSVVLMIHCYYHQCRYDTFCTNISCSLCCYGSLSRLIPLFNFVFVFSSLTAKWTETGFILDGCVTSFSLIHFWKTLLKGKCNLQVTQQNPVIRFPPPEVDK